MGTKLLPIMSRFAVFISAFGHITPLPMTHKRSRYEGRNLSVLLPSILTQFFPIDALSKNRLQ